MLLSSESFSQRGEEGFLCISKVQGLLLSNHFFSFRGKELIFPGWKRKAAWKGEGGCGLNYGQVTHVFWHISAVAPGSGKCWCINWKTKPTSCHWANRVRAPEAQLSKDLMGLSLQLVTALFCWRAEGQLEDQSEKEMSASFLRNGHLWGTLGDTQDIQLLWLSNREGENPQEVENGLTSCQSGIWVPSQIKLNLETLRWCEIAS